MTEGTDCYLHRVHHPSVAVFRGVIIDGEAVALCGTGYDNLRVCVEYMKGGPSPSAKIGRETWDLAQRVINARKVSGL